MKRMDKPTSWTMLKEQIKYIIAHPELCSTLVVDTIDWAEQLCIDDICARANKRVLKILATETVMYMKKKKSGVFLIFLMK